MEELKTSNNQILMLSDINNLFFDNKEITIVFDKENNAWFKGKDIAKILDYSNTNDTIKTHVEEEDKNILKNIRSNYKIECLSHNKKNTIYINKHGIESLLIKSKKIVDDNLINNLITKFDLNLNKIIKTKEQDSIGKIIKAFRGLNYKLQYKLDNYKIDLYFIDYKLAIECDENNHLNYNQEKEIERENYIKKQLNCTFIRFDPDDRNFDILEIINKIFLFIHNNK